MQRRFISPNGILKRDAVEFSRFDSAEDVGEVVGADLMNMSKQYKQTVDILGVD
jgi:hypothetical protein